MKGIPFLTKEENRTYAKFRKLMIRINKSKGDSSMPDKKSEVQTMCVSAMAHTIEETIGVDVSNAVAKHGNTFVRICENTLRMRIFNSKERRRKAAIARLDEIANA